MFRSYRMSCKNGLIFTTRSLVPTILFWISRHTLQHYPVLKLEICSKRMLPCSIISWGEILWFYHTNLWLFVVFTHSQSWKRCSPRFIDELDYLNTSFRYIIVWTTCITEHINQRTKISREKSCIQFLLAEPMEGRYSITWVIPRQCQPGFGDSFWQLIIPRMVSSACRHRYGLAQVPRVAFRSINMPWIE